MIGKAFYKKYGMCEACYYDWDEPCLCRVYSEREKICLIAANCRAKEEGDE